VASRHPDGPRTVIPDVLPVRDLRPSLAPFVAVLARGTGLDPEDLEQEVWLRAVERGRPAPRDRPGWLMGLAVREALAGRERRRETPVARVTQRHRGPEEALLTAELSGTVRRAVARLSGRCPELLEELAASPGLTYGQLAERLGVPRGSIGPLRSRCLGCLRTLLHRHRPE